MRREVVATVAVLAALLSPPARAAEDAYLIQPTESPRGLRISGDSRNARILSPGGAAQPLPLRRGEQPTTLVETADGWLAAGLARRPDRRGLFLLEESGGGVRRLPAPRGGRMPIRVLPVPLVDQGSLAGLLWLEGSEPGRLEVRAAVRDGEGWGPPERVSTRSRGTQTGLAAAILPDGAWLAVWASFDGNDDEIVWAERRGGVWSRPRRLHAGNRTPDVTPAIIATESGALVAWSRREADGQYRLRLAAFDGGQWIAERPVGSPGTLYPSFVRTAERTFLMARSAAPRGWLLLELDGQGAPLRSALASEPTPQRPLVEADTGAVALRWARRSGAAALTWSER